LVGASTLVHWLAGRRLDGFWIMPDEAIYARRGLDLWESLNVPILHGEGLAYGVLYPALAGLPLAVGDFATGYASLKLLQALVISLAAVPVYVWGRRLMPLRWTVVAVILTLASPLLLYSGLVMTEVLFYPVATVALLAIARSIELGDGKTQALALAAIAATIVTRVQGLVLVFVFAGAVVLDAAFRRDVRRVGRFLLLWTVCAAAAVVTLARPGVFGAYAEVVAGGYPLRDALRLTLWHLGWIVISTGILPAAALVLLAVRATRGLEPDPRVRALVSVAIAGVCLFSVQVGFFASRYAPHLLERDLAALPPVLFLAFGVWLAREAPRPRVAAAATALALLAAVVALPWNELVDERALPDSFSLAILYRMRAHDAATIASLAALVALAVFVLVPRRLRAVLPAIVLGLLVASSAAASREISERVHYDQTQLVGSPRNWIDAGSGHRPVAYVYDGETYFNGVWQAVVWNRSVDRVVSLGRSRVPGPMPQRSIVPGGDGELGFPERYVVASAPHEFRGAAVATIAQPGTDVGGMTLWRLDPPARISTVRRGILADGDMTEPGRLTVWDCAGGRLELTLLPKATQVVGIFLDGKLAVRAKIGGLDHWNGTVDVPPAPEPRVCRFTIDGQTLLGSTRIAFVRR
jgi:hypothetical protein